jgi:hypothetical protein
MFKKTPKRGIKVTVTETRYDVQWSDPITPREIRLAALLKGQGGVSDTVPPGDYEFNAVRKGPLSLWLSLDPWEDK